MRYRPLSLSLSGVVLAALLAAGSPAKASQRPVNGIQIQEASTDLVDIKSVQVCLKGGCPTLEGELGLAYSFIGMPLGQVSYQVCDAKGRVLETGLAKLDARFLASDQTAHFQVNLKQIPQDASVIKVVYED